MDERKFFLLKFYLTEVKFLGKSSAKNYSEDTETIYSVSELSYLFSLLWHLSTFTYGTDSFYRLLDSCFLSNIPAVITLRKGVEKHKKLVFRDDTDIFYEINSEYHRMINNSASIYSVKTKKMLDKLILFNKIYNSNRYKGAFISSCIAVLFGVFIPLVFINFNINKYLSLASVYCSEVCISMLLSFLFDIYYVLMDKVGNLSNKVN